jgi:hypothetical protein
MSPVPPLKPLHADDSLIRLKMEEYAKGSTDALIASLAPGQAGCLKTRPDGTIVDGHHRIKILRDRGSMSMRCHVNWSPRIRFRGRDSET